MEIRIKPDTHTPLSRFLTCIGKAGVGLLIILSIACSAEKEHTAPAINPQDSVATMTTYGVNTLISDSGIIKYRIITEQWEVNTNTNPTKWLFVKGIHLQQFDQKLHVQAHIQADTAYYYDSKRLWELRGRVEIHTKNQLQFKSEELFWDENEHLLYSNKFSQVKTPDRQLEGAHFTSNEQMTKYHVTNTKAEFQKADFDNVNEKEQQTDEPLLPSRPPKQHAPKN